MQEAGDASLLTAVAAGDDDEPLAELYRRYGPRILGLAQRFLSDRSHAEEIVQETFVRVWRHAGSFEPSRGSVATYIFTIARRLIIDRFRRRTPAAANPLPEGCTSEDDEVDRLLVRLEIRDALAALSDAHRQVLEFTYFGQLDQSETAALLAVPVGTVKSRTYYALRSLEAMLGEHRTGGDSDRREVRPALPLNAPLAPSVYPTGDDLIAA
jgi:RNA polymerase sigma-70 factor (ECF subfamily)